MAMMLTCLSAAIAFGAIGGCAATHSGTNTNASTKTGSAADVLVNVELSQGYALLHDLLNRNREVTKLLIIKSPSKPLTARVKQIAADSAAGADWIKTMAADEPAVSLESQGLPPAELEARAGMESDAGGKLLFASGQTLDRRLIIEQLSATRYAVQLGKAVNSLDDDKLRSEKLGLTCDAFEAHADALFTLLEQVGAAE